jgi:hypothetical protein
LSPLFSLVLGSSLEFLVQHYRIKDYHLCGFIIELQFRYFHPFVPTATNDNDIVYLNKKIKILDTKTVYATKKVVRRNI